MKRSAQALLRLFVIVFLSSTSIDLDAQYTLTDDDVVVEDGVLKSCSYDFAVTDIVIPATLDGQTVVEISGTSTYAGAFRDKGITSLVLPSSLVHIGTYAFYENDIDSLNLRACTLLETIKETAFRRNSLKHLDLSMCTKLLMIEKLAFTGNSFVSGFELPVNAEYSAFGWKDSDGNLYAGGDVVTDMSVSYRVPVQYTLSDEDVVVVDGMIETCSYTFDQSDIVIPATLDGQTVTGILGNKSTSLAVFYNKGISSLKLPESLVTIGRNAFANNSIDVLDFSGMSNLELIGYAAFDDNIIESLSFTGCTNLRKIETNAFRDNNLLSVDLSVCTALNWIDYYVFTGNYSLTGIVLPTNSAPGFAGWQDSNGTVYEGGGTAPKYAGAMRAIIPYTLTDADVIVTNGIIESCSYDFSASVITVPDELDGQMVVGFADVEPPVSYGDLPTGVFVNKGMLEIVLPVHIDTIGASVFSNNMLMGVDFSGCSSLVYIGEKAFEENVISSLDLSDCSSLHTIGDYAFTENEISSLNLSNCTSLVRIGAYAFQLNDLVSLDFSACSNLISIDMAAFYNNSIANLDLSSCVNLGFIGIDAFSNNSLSGLELPILAVSGFMGWRDADGNKYEGGAIVTNFRVDYSAMASYILKDEDVVMNDGVLESCSYDFYFTDIIIPETLDGQTVRKIGDSYSNDYSLRQGVFEYKGITSLVLPGTLDSIGISGFARNSIEKLDLRGSAISYIGVKAFEGSEIDTLLLANSSSLKTIERSAFLGNILELIDLENCSSLDTLRKDVFKNGGNVKSVHLSGCSSLCYIHEDAFSGAGASLSIELPASNSGITYGWIDGNDVRYNNGDMISDFTILYRVPIVYTLGDDDVEVVDGFIESCSYDFGHSDIVIPSQLDGMEVRGIKSGYSSGVFQGKGITSIVLPSGLDTIGDIAFYDNKIVSLDLSVVNPTYIGKSAFKGNDISGVSFAACSNLRYIAVEAFFENRIGSLDFSECTALEMIGENAFRENEIAHIDFGNCNSLVRIGMNSFKVNKLVSIDLSVCPVLQVLEHGCFSNNDLVDIDFTGVEHLTFIDAYVFENNEFTSFALPAHFESELDWIDVESNKYAQGEQVSDFHISYRLPIVYTLSDEDVLVVDGVIWKVMYDFLLTDIIIPNTLDGQTVTGIKDGVSSLYNSYGVFMGKGITSVQLPGGILNLGENAFRYNSIDSVNLSVCSGLVSVGNNAFKSNSIAKIQWSNGIETIGSGAFSGNDLSEIDITALTKLTYIGGSAFSNNDLNYFIIPSPEYADFLYWAGANDVVVYGDDVIYNFESYYRVVYDSEEVYNAVFRVSDGTNLLVGAGVTINGATYYTDEDGEASVHELGGGVWPYAVTHHGYVRNESTIYIIDEDVEEEVVLTLESSPVYMALFRISSGDESVPEATLTIAGGTYHSDAYGEVLAINLKTGDYDYAVSAEGFEDYSGTITISDGDIEEAVEMIMTGVVGEQGFSVNVYPNPCSDIMHVSLPVSEDMVSIEIVGLNGSAVGAYMDFGSTEALIDLSGCESGVYILRVRTGAQKVYVGRFVKM